MRLRAQQEAADAPVAPPRAVPTPAPAQPGERRVSVDSFAAMFPDLVSRSGVARG